MLPDNSGPVGSKYTRARHGENERGAVIDKQRSRSAAKALQVGSTLAFGLLSWTAAHELSLWILDHAHIVVAGQGHWSHHPGSFALISGCLAVGALLALLSAPTRTEPTRRPVSLAAVRCSTLLAIGGFVGTDITGRALAGDFTAPSLLVLLIGLGVYTLIGAAASLLWHCWVSAIPWSLAPLQERRREVPRRAAMGATPSDRPRPRQWARNVAGRSPPLPAF